MGLTWKPYEMKNENVTEEKQLEQYTDIKEKKIIIMMTK
jgi:hypothetical protein